MRINIDHTIRTKYMGRMYHIPVKPDPSCDYLIISENLEIKRDYDVDLIDNEPIFRFGVVRMFIDGIEIRPETLMVADDGINFERPGVNYKFHF